MGEEDSYVDAAFYDMRAAAIYPRGVGDGNGEKFTGETYPTLACWSYFSAIDDDVVFAKRRGAFVGASAKHSILLECHGGDDDGPESEHRGENM
ncbi:hypothetical protein DMENIID0001_056550 [Sergentomyia squamirostris]